MTLPKMADAMPKAVRLLEVGMKLPKEVVICRKWPSECLKMFSRLFSCSESYLKCHRELALMEAWKGVQLLLL
jgi:hypothetical protein